MHNRNISVIGLGYVGLPVVVAFGEKKHTIGFDINAKRVTQLRDGIDLTYSVTPDELRNTNVTYTTKASDLKKSDFHIVAVPTPVDSANQPDFTPLERASETVGSILKKGDIVVYESTVYPGATEEVCVPILEQFSKLKCGVDFFIGYSPERVNPGDTEHTFKKIRKVVSGQNAEILEIVASVYSSVVEAGVHRAPSIKVAEAAKVIENTQRDINIAFMNELAVIFERMDIETNDVLEAAGTKWNFLKFTPGLVGGHCIGVDPYYLTHKAEQLGHIPQVILAGRRINDGMGAFIAQKAIKEMIHAGQNILGTRALVLGITFKENCPDTRNSKVPDIIAELSAFGIQSDVYDPQAQADVVHEEYGFELTQLKELQKRKYGLVVLAVSHNDFKTFTAPQINDLLTEKAVVIDVKSFFSKKLIADLRARYWRL